jgi:uncharacterized protein YndB with AHSA1/START domain
MQSPNNIFIHRKFGCSVTELFTWLIQPELITQWFGPKGMTAIRVETDVRVGGTYMIELKTPDNITFQIIGEYLEISSPEQLVFSLHYLGLPGNPPKSTVKIVLTEEGPRESTLALFQDFEFLPSDFDRRTKGWEHMLQVLQKLVQRDS